LSVGLRCAAAHDEGNALIHDLIDATVSSISAAPELQR